MPSVHTIHIAALDVGEIVGVIVLFLYGLFWLLRRIAEGKEQERRLAEKRKAQGETKEEGKEEVYIADEEEVKRFLQTLGAGPTHEPEPPARPAPRPVQQPSRPSARPPRRPLRPEPVLGVARPQPPRPKPEAPAAPAPQLEPAEAEYQFGSAVQDDERPHPPKPWPRPKEPTPAPETAARPGAALEDRLKFPQLSGLQRAVVLSEILQRKRGPYRLHRQ